MGHLSPRCYAWVLSGYYVASNKWCYGMGSLYNNWKQMQKFIKGGSPVVRTPCFHCQRLGVWYLVGQLRSHNRCSQKKKKIINRHCIHYYSLAISLTCWGQYIYQSAFIISSKNLMFSKIGAIISKMFTTLGPSSYTSRMWV